MGLWAYLVAGLIVGALVWFVRNGPGYPKLATLLVFGLAGGAIGGLGWNAFQDEPMDHLDGTGFTLAVLVALVLLVGVDVRVRRNDD
jgi:uncharacterized membrane protein YeaQ/YmgE (transglycosylase-associated protein family)